MRSPDLETVWTVAAKDLSVFRKKRSIFYSVVLFPAFVSVGLPALIWVLQRRSAFSADYSAITGVLDAFAFFFVIMAGVIPTAISAYSIVGEKLEKSLEPLLATPARDSEILMGKSLAAFLPSITAASIGGTVFMVLIDLVTMDRLGYLYFPNWTFAGIFLIVVPLVIVCSVSLNVIVSSRVSDVRTANSIGALVILPFAGVYVATEVGIVSLTVTNLLLIAGVVAVADALLLYFASATFRREEILTKWK